MSYSIISYHNISFFNLWVKLEIIQMLLQWNIIIFHGFLYLVVSTYFIDQNNEPCLVNITTSYQNIIH